MQKHHPNLSVADAIKAYYQWLIQSEILTLLHDLRAKVREMDLILEYLIEQNSEHFRCLRGFQQR